MYYSIRRPMSRKHLAIKSMYIAYILIGMAIGAYLGFKWAVTTLPLPYNQTIYISK